MPTMAASTHPPDDFDMAKLQKTLKQRQRRAVRNSAHVAKLTPAEIRSLNSGALSSKTGSLSSSKSTSSPSRSRRSTNATPPTSPDDPPAYQAQTQRNSVSRHNSINIPTPPHTPNGHRRLSQSSTHGHHHQAHANGIIHAPRPRGSMHAAFMSANGLSSRPSSSGSSTYRGLPTYRGPEVTRTGSINMLQHPSQQIVNNPLSYFSRPRQSHTSTSPEHGRRDSDVSLYHAQSLRNARANSLPNVSAPSSRQPSPQRVTDSPVSMIADDTDKFPVLDPADDPHNQPRTPSDEEDGQRQLEFPQPETQPNPPTTSTIEKPAELDASESPKKEKEKQKRFTIHAALFGDKSSHENADKKLKKMRRRTMSSSKVEEQSNPKEHVAPPVPPSEEANIDVPTSAPNEDVSDHPAVRPLSLIVPDESKGKEREISSAPVYSRCSCCGRLKRPHGFNSDLSPVLENEHLRANLSFEMDRTAGSSGRRSSDASREKFIPIIPMQVGENDTRQASVEPYYHARSETPIEQHPRTDYMEMEIATSSPVRQPLRQKNSSPIRTQRLSAPPRFVRFASLHGRRDGNTGPIVEEDEEGEHETDEHHALMMEHDGSDQVFDPTTMSGAVIAEDETAIGHAVPEVSSASRAFIEPVTNFDNISNAKSGSDIFYTPAREASPSTTDRNPLSVVQQHPLPEPSVGQPSFLPAPEIEDSNLKPVSAVEPPVSSAPTTKVTIISPLSVVTPNSLAPAHDVSLTKSSSWERELTATFLGSSSGSNGATSSVRNGGVDLSLRPKFSFESMRSTIDVAAAANAAASAKDNGKGKGKAREVVAGDKKATGKRRSLGPSWLGGASAVKA